MNNKERILYLDLLRCVAMFFVIVIHAASYTYKGENWAELSFYNSISAFCVPIFVMVSGAVFLNPDYEIKIKKYVVRIIIAYTVWSLLYAVYHSRILFEHDFNNLYLFIVFWAKGNFHLWYLWMLLGLYLLVPILRQVAKDKKASLWLIAICILFNSIPNFIDSLTQIKPISIVFETNLQGVINNYLLLNPSMYVGYFVLGNYLNKMDITKYKHKYLYVSITFIIYLLVVGLGMYYSVKNQKMITYCNYTTPLQCLFSTGIFLFAKSIEIKRIEPFVKALSICSFGIYLIHPFVQSGMNKAGILYLSMNFALNVLLVSILTLVISFAIIRVMKKIPIVNKYLV